MAQKIAEKEQLHDEIARINAVLEEPSEVASDDESFLVSDDDSHLGDPSHLQGKKDLSKNERSAFTLPSEKNVPTGKKAESNHLNKTQFYDNPLASFLGASLAASWTNLHSGFQVIHCFTMFFSWVSSRTNISVVRNL